MTREGTREWPVRIRGERVLIREAREEDRAALIRLMTDPITRQYLGGSVSFASQQALELSPLGLTWGSWVIADAADDELLGSISLDYDRGEVQLAYALLPEHTGRGYAGESCRALLEWARENLEDETVIAVTQSRNKRSVDLLRRLGFTVRRGLEELGAQQLLMERSLLEPLPRLEEIRQDGAPPPPSGAPRPAPPSSQLPADGSPARPDPQEGHDS